VAPVKFFPKDELPKSVCAVKTMGTPATGFPLEVTKMTDRFRPFPTTSREGASSTVAVVTFFAVVLTDVLVEVVVVVAVLPEDVVLDDAVVVLPEDVVLDDAVVVLPEDVVLDDVAVDEVVLLEVVVLPEDVVDVVVLPGSTTASQPFCMLSIPSQSMMHLIWNVPSVPAMNWIVVVLCAVSMTADFRLYPMTSIWCALSKARLSQPGRCRLAGQASP